MNSSAGIIISRFIRIIDVAVLVFTIGIMPAHAAKRQLRLLFLGNSFTGNAPGLPDAVKEMINRTSATDTVVQCDAGLAFGQNLDKHYNNSAIMRMVRSGIYDYISVQGYDNNGGDRANTVHYATRIIQEAKIVGSKPLVFMAQANINSPDKWDSVIVTYTKIADSMHVVKVPCFPSWRAARAAKANYPTWDSDQHHQSDYGTYLNMCSFYAAITGTSPVGSTYLFAPAYNKNNPIQPSDMSFMQQTAWSTWQATAQNITGGEIVDNSAPQVLSVKAIAGEGAYVTFDEMVTAGSAGNAANYTFSTGAGITNAQLLWDARTVWLQSAGLKAGTVGVTVRNITDRFAASPHTLMSSVLISGTSTPRGTWTDCAIGYSPVLASVTHIGSSDMRLEGIGGDLSGVSDICTYSYQRMSGNCEITARIDSIEYTHEYARAGVLIRQSEDPSGPFAFVSPAAYGAYGTSPDAHGVEFNGRVDTTSYADGFGSAAGINVPCWVRLRRSGDVFQAFTSSDGVNWTAIANTKSIPMGTNILIGIAASASSFGKQSTARVSNILVTGSPVGVVSVPGAIQAKQTSPRLARVMAVRSSPKLLQVQKTVLISGRRTAEKGRIVVPILIP